MAFAPTWSILTPMLDVRRRDGAAGVARAWPKYVADYTAEIERGTRSPR